MIGTFTVPYILLLTLHLVLVGVWLGADIGSVIAFRKLRDASLPVGVRRQMTLLTELLDVGPRSAIVLLIVLGAALSYMGGWGLRQLGSWFPSTAGLVAVVWTGAVWHSYWVGRAPRDNPRAPVHQRVRDAYRKVELWLRVGVSAVLAAVAAASLLGVVSAFRMDWIAWKLLLLLGISLCGVGLRYAVPQVRSAFGVVSRHGSSPEREAALAVPLRNAQILIVLIWIQIVVMVWLSVVKPW